MQQIIPVILAAGEGKRMKSQRQKTLHEICGISMIDWALRAASTVSDTQPVVIVGHQREQLQQALDGRAQLIVQNEQLGTGHALICAKSAFAGRHGYVLVMAGDMPLVRGETLQALVRMAAQGGLAAAMLTAELDDPTGYGRVIRNEAGHVQAIVEHKDADEEQIQIHEVSSLFFCFEIQSLCSCLERLDNQNAAGEYYLTDLIMLLHKDGMQVGAMMMDDPTEGMGVNTLEQLSQADAVMRMRINRHWMSEGVTMIDPSQTYIGPDVVIGADTVIYPGNHLEGSTRIGDQCMLLPNNRIVDSHIDDSAQIQSSVILSSHIGARTTVGPYAYIRPGTSVAADVRIGDFVELKNAVIGRGSKVSHLSYIGDSEVGEQCNVGCGVVFVNYDGQMKHHAKVGDRCFIGCNVNLISPVQVGNDAYIAAGSTVTEDVPEGSLCIARSRQSIKEGWVARRKKPEQP